MFIPITIFQYVDAPYMYVKMMIKIQRIFFTLTDLFVANFSTTFQEKIGKIKLYNAEFILNFDIKNFKIESRLHRSYAYDYWLIRKRIYDCRMYRS